MTFLFRLFQLAFPLIPIVMFDIAFRLPALIDRVYSRGVYPVVVEVQTQLFGSIPTSVAEPALAVVIGLVGVWLCVRLFTRDRDERPRGGIRRLLRLLVWAWFLGGVVFSIFLFCWGFNYARGRLADRMELDATDIRAEEVVSLARSYARNANQAYRAAGYSPAASRVPIDFSALNASLDQLFARRAIPGDPIRGETIPLKPLRSSLLLSYLGISGIYIPFTGEPSLNAHQPDPSLPYVAAHEKAHQRGITNEGEASFAAFLVTTSAEAPPHVRYSGYLMSASRLMSQASRYLSKNELATTWEVFEQGPREDLRMIREYWLGFEGPASEATQKVNHRYLESMRVPGGAESYDEVVQLLVAWERAREGE